MRINRVALQGALQRNIGALGLLFAGILAGAGVIKYWPPAGPDAFAIQSARMQIAQLDTQVKGLQGQQTYPSLWGSWSDMKLHFTSCGVDIAKSTSDTGKKGVYDGPVDAWQVRLTGEAASVLVCYLEYKDRPGIQPGQIAIQRGKANLLVNLLGRPPIGVQAP